MATNPRSAARMAKVILEVARAHHGEFKAQYDHYTLEFVETLCQVSQQLPTSLDWRDETGNSKDRDGTEERALTIDSDSCIP